MREELVDYDISLDVFPIHGLAKPIFTVLEKIREKIENGEYSVIIGDDSSGRIPTYIIRKIIEKVYKKNGIKNPKTIFITGMPIKNYELKEERIEFIKKNIRIAMRKRISGRGLIVTEYIETGLSIFPIVKALKEMNIPFDVISLSSMNNKSLEFAESTLGTKIITSEENNSPPDIYRRSDLSGVDKYDFTPTGRAEAVREYDKKGNLISSKARKAADKVVKHIFDNY